MKTFIEKLKTETIFLLECPSETIRVLSVPDEIISGVWHIYIEKKATKGKYGRELNYCGALINDTIWDAAINLSAYKERLGFNVDYLHRVKEQIDAEVSKKATRHILTAASSLAEKEIALAKSDIKRMKTEPRTEYEQKYDKFMYYEHKPQANEDIIKNICSDSFDKYYSKGRAYQAFYNGVFDKLEFCLVTSSISDSEALEYLTKDEQERPAVIDRFAGNLIKKAEQELGESNNTIVNKLARHLIAEEFYDELTADKQGEHYLIKEIYDKTHGVEMSGAKTVNMTVDIDGEVFTLNIDKDYIKHENIISALQILPAATREQMKKQLRKRYERLGFKYNEIFLKDILEITYKKKTLYKKDAC